MNLVTAVSELIFYTSQLHTYINLWNIVMKVQGMLFSHVKKVYLQIAWINACS
jgi:hypothetical protein